IADVAGSSVHRPLDIRRCGVDEGSQEDGDGCIQQLQHELGARIVTAPTTCSRVTHYPLRQRPGCGMEHGPAGSVPERTWSAGHMLRPATAQQKSKLDRSSMASWHAR